MALFKIEQGLAADLAKNRPNSVQGYCYFTKDDGKFYIDITDGTAITPSATVSMTNATRIPINSYLSDWAARAYADKDGNDIESSYASTLSLSEYTLKLLAKDSTELKTITLPSSVESAKKLVTKRKINGTDFDGTADITTANWGTARTITIGNTGKSVNGSKNISWSLAEIGAAASSHTHKDGDIKWGSSLSGNISPLDMAASNIHSANRFCFSNPTGIIVEYSRDGGATWIDYGANDDKKINLVSGIGTIFYIGGHNSSITTNDKLRITLNAYDMKVYTRLYKLLINISTNGASGCKVKIEKAFRGSETVFSYFNTYNISGWSGWNSISIGRILFGGESHQTSNTGALRLTFEITSLSSSYNNALTIIDIIGLGDTYWSYPSSMAKTGHIYSYDANKNVTFPANITATSFIGNASTATKFASAQKIKLTGAITGEASSQAGWTIATTLADGIVKTANIANAAVTNAKLANSSISINGKSVSLGGSLSLADIGLNQALRFIGVTTTAIVDGSTATSITLKNGSTHNAAIGDVVINELNHQEYVWLGSNWELLGDESSYEVKGTAQNLIDKIKFNPATASVLGSSTTFTNGTSSVSFAAHTTKNAVGIGATFTVTNPSISLSLNKTNVKATASGAKVTLLTDTAITDIADPTIGTFVKSYPGATSKLVTTTIKGVAGTTSVSKISSNTSVTATKISSYGTAAVLTAIYTADTETLVFNWTPNQIAAGSNVTATNTAYSDATVATANSSATTVATGSLSSSGTGSSVMTGLGTATTATAITAMGALTAKNFATAINEITQPTITLATGATAGTGVISLATGSGSATASGGAVKFNSTDTVAVITGLGAATAAAQKITVGTNNRITALTSATTLTKS